MLHAVLLLSIGGLDAVSVGDKSGPYVYKRVLFLTSIVATLSSVNSLRLVTATFPLWHQSHSFHFCSFSFTNSSKSNASGFLLNMCTPSNSR
mmetsp:Transcript_20583/g.34863  ORF Transcript_20583/g.34863 Transcript_20583/m.34863 type:complete len:92 (-) Transcript_20583:523-798(-)